MNYNNYTNDEYTMIIHHNKTQYKKIQQVKYNFRDNINLKDLDDGVMLNFPYNNTYYSYKSLSTSIPLSRVFRRSGVIPFTYIKNNDNIMEKFFCMGIDAKFGTLTDFGGGVKKYETFAAAASRELSEESLNVFNFTPESIYNCSVGVYDSNMIIMFLHIKVDNPNKIVEDFFKNFSNATQSENKGIIWISESIFYDLIKSGKSIRKDGLIYPSVYKPVADLLRSVSNINEIV